MTCLFTRVYQLKLDYKVKHKRTISHSNHPAPSLYELFELFWLVIWRQILEVQGEAGIKKGSTRGVSEGCESKVCECVSWDGLANGWMDGCMPNSYQWLCRIFSAHFFCMILFELYSSVGIEKHKLMHTSHTHQTNTPGPLLGA